MGKCIFSFDKIEILNQKSDTEHSDNDWLSMAWSINEKVYSKTIPLKFIAKPFHCGILPVLKCFILEMSLVLSRTTWYVQTPIQ